MTKDIQSELDFDQVRGRHKNEVKTVELVKATIQDLQTIQRLQMELCEYHNTLGIQHNLNDTVIKNETEFTDLSKNYITVFKIQNSNTTVGILTLRSLYDFGHITQLYIKPQYRNKGYFKEIFERLVNKFSEVIIEVYNDNKNALDMCIHLGFSPSAYDIKARKYYMGIINFLR